MGIGYPQQGWAGGVAFEVSAVKMLKVDDEKN
jgi:hypothetical protein